MRSYRSKVFRMFTDWFWAARRELSRSNSARLVEVYCGGILPSFRRSFWDRQSIILLQCSVRLWDGQGEGFNQWCSCLGQLLIFADRKTVYWDPQSFEKQGLGAFRDPVDPQPNFTCDLIDLYLILETEALKLNAESPISDIIFFLQKHQIEQLDEWRVIRGIIEQIWLQSHFKSIIETGCTSFLLEARLQL